MSAPALVLDRRERETARGAARGRMSHVEIDDPVVPDPWARLPKVGLGDIEKARAPR